MADAAYVMLCRDARSHTGQFLLDEDVLEEAGVADLDRYRHLPGEPLLADLFTEPLAP